jgi:hypothetical protein
MTGRSPFRPNFQRIMPVIEPTQHNSDPAYHPLCIQPWAVGAAFEESTLLASESSEPTVPAMFAPKRPPMAVAQMTVTTRKAIGKTACFIKPHLSKK